MKNSKGLLRVLCLGLWLSFGHNSYGANAAPTILVYGDSLSAAYGIPRDQGWANLLQLRLIKEGYPYQVANASISGETSRGGLSRFPATVQQFKPKLVIIELGANDGLQGLPVKNLQDNLAEIIRNSQANGAKVLLLGMKIPPNYGLQYTEMFSKSYVQLANQYKTALVPFFMEGVAGNPALIQADGLHPIAGAQGKLLDNVWAGLKTLLRK